MSMQRAQLALVEESTMNTIMSTDGTAIAFEQQGNGPALILIDGAMTTRLSGSKPELARLLAQHFTVTAMTVGAVGIAGTASRMPSRGKSKTSNP